MNLKLRRGLFYTLILIFIILAIFIIPYSNGWRFDFKNFSFVKLGGIYIETSPMETQIQIDRINFQTKPGFIKSGLVVANLFPKTYYVSVQKEGYQPWTKNITVRPSLVTQIPQIILLPKNWEKQLIAENVEDFFMGSTLLYKDTQNNLKIEEKVIKGNEFLGWFSGEKSILVYNTKNKIYFVINISQNNTALNVNLIFNNLKDQKNIKDLSQIKTAVPHFSDKNKIFLLTSNAIYLLDLNKPSLDLLKNGNFTLLDLNEEEIYFSDSNSLYSYNLFTKKESSIFNSKNTSNLKISANKQFLAFNDSENLVLLNKLNENGNEGRLISDVLYFNFSPDNKKLATMDKNGEIKIFFIGDDYELFNKELLSFSVFNISDIDIAYPVLWHSNSSYIFIKTKNDFRMMEINDDPPTNFHTVNVVADKYFYNPKTEDIYVIQNNNLYRLIK
jgi:hypothetical protein